MAAGPMDIIWFLILFSTLQPILKQKFLAAARQRLISRIERERGSRVIVLIHRQETMGFLGFPVFKYINIEDSEQILRAVEMTDPDVPLDLILHTPGGLVLASVQIARALAKHKAPVRVIVPHYAMSGGTLIALGADEIVMSPNAVLGPVDPQLGEFPAASLLSVVENKPVAEIDDRTLVFADVGRKAMHQVRSCVKDLLVQNSYTPETAENLSNLLSTGTWTHDYPITFEGARELGLRVSSAIPRSVIELMNLYPQPIRQQQPTVEYLPVPRHREVGRPVSKGGI
jgi:ClpP class serine protease